MINVLITGVAGFIGSRIAKEFINNDIKVFGVDDLSNGKEVNIDKKVEFLKLDLSLKENFKKIRKDIDVILHLAGQSSGEISFDNPVLDLEKNTVTTLNLINFGIEAGAKKIIYASSLSVYGNVLELPIDENFNCSPLSCYGVGKLSSEKYLEVFKKKLPYIAFRMFNVYGPGQDMENLRQGMVSIYLAQALSKNSIIVKGNLNRFRDFIYIDDVVNIWMRSTLEEIPLNQVINLGTGTKTYISNLLNILSNNFTKLEIFQKDSTPGDQNGIYANTQKLINTFGKIDFTSLEDGLSKFIKYERKQKYENSCNHSSKNGK